MAIHRIKERFGWERVGVGARSKGVQGPDAPFLLSNIPGQAVRIRGDGAFSASAPRTDDAPLGGKPGTVSHPKAYARAKMTPFKLN